VEHAARTRREIVAAVRAGSSQRSAADRFGVALATVQLWLNRAADQPLDDVDWADRPPVARRIRRTGRDLEDRILDLRRELREDSVLGEYGPVAIHRELVARAAAGERVPAVRTIARILERRGALDAKRRVRRAAPPLGWYLPDVRRHESELDSFDVIEGLRLKGGIPLDILTGISLLGGLPGTWPTISLRARRVVEAMGEHWQEIGLPGYAQFDNDPRFVGGLAHPNSIGPVIRFCLAVGVVPVFAPPRESGFQAAVEAYNGRWQRKVWARFWDPTVDDLVERSDTYVGAVRRHSAVRIEAAPDRGPFPDRAVDLDRPPSGRIVFIRRSSDDGVVSVLKVRYPVDRSWVHRLVRVELDLDARRVSCFALRRREPDDQPCLAELPFHPPARWYR
jgi:hypothetical protein